MFYYIAVLGIAIILNPFFKKENYRIYGVVITVMLAFLAYHIEVLPTSDLTRHFSNIDMYRSMNFTKALSVCLSKDNPMTHIVFFIFSRFEDDRIFPAVMVFISYLLMINLICNACEDMKLEKNIYNLCLAFLLLNYNFYLLTNAIRMWFVFSVFFYCLYEESVRKKHRIFCWIIYCLLVLFHYASLILVLCRFVSFVTKGSLSSSRKLLISILAVIALVLIVLYISTTDFSIFVMEKIDSYEEYSKRGTWQTIAGWIKILMVVLMIISVRRFKENPNSYYNLTILLVFILNISQISNYQMVLRFSDGMMACASVILCQYMIKKTAANSKDITVYDGAIFLGTAVNFAATMILCYAKYLNFVW